MEELQKYVDSLFKHQRKNAQTEELKEEILSNMLAKKNDLMSQGIDEKEAIKEAKDGLLSIDGLIDDNQLTNMAKYNLDCSYTLLLNSILFWIFTMPLLFMGLDIFVVIGFLITLVSAGLYVYRLYCSTQKENYAFLSLLENQKRKKTAWIIWTVFFVVSVSATLFVLFGSNVWFDRPVHINVPYDFAKIIVMFYIPLLTIFIPLTISKCSNILVKCERRSSDEN